MFILSYDRNWIYKGRIKDYCFCLDITISNEIYVFKQKTETLGQRQVGTNLREQLQRTWTTEILITGTSNGTITGPIPLATPPPTIPTAAMPLTPTQPGRRSHSVWRVTPSTYAWHKHWTIILDNTWLFLQGSSFLSLAEQENAR